jgi:hypothetical protein
MQKGRKMRMSLLAVLAVAFVLMIGGTALAQDSPTQDAYGGVLGNQVENSADATQELGANAAESGTLPFTGFDAGIAGIVGIGLVGLGFAMRRGSRRQQD